MAVRKPNAEAEAQAVIAEAAAVARATAVFDRQVSDIATEKLDSVLMLIDVLIAARRIEVKDAEWILPALGYEVDLPLIRQEIADEDADTDDGSADG